MTRTKTFGFSFDVSNEFRRGSLAADRLIGIEKDSIARQEWAVGPRGGMYELVTPPDRWREKDEYDRDHTRFLTKREGRYVRPGRVLLDSHRPTFSSVRVYANDGVVVLPDGRRVAVAPGTRAVDVPVVS